ncbi:transcription termination factor Rho [Nocardioides sp. J2M5]|uniref:transcription termination factor Rho n=1 Tax=Nocardioides palaemonis TaxID=2829810 RepID=UPI001BAD176A|nr:transcription termination factor Rho [Nocardioides palaemonis]MBS2938766.1 transcription termination factor Rho [Nocardioides palaemonis]
MTETPSAPAENVDATTPDGPAPKAARKSGGLSSMLLADLKSMAAGLGVAGAGSMKKAQLVEAIKAAQSGPKQEATKQEDEQAAEPVTRTTVRTRTRRQRQAEQAGEADRAPEQAPEQSSERESEDKPEQKPEQKDRKAKQDQKQGKQERQQQDQKPKQDRQQQDRQQQDRQQQEQKQAQQNQQQQANQQSDDDEDGEGGSRRNRRRRGRDRTTARTGGRNEPDTTILEDDVLVPAAGILDVLENCAFVRTSGYLPGTEDVYLSLSMVRKYHLRRGDAVVGQVRQPREGERREKFNPMVRIDSVNGTEAEGAKERPEFGAATPVHPYQRLRLATDADLVGKVVDIAAPVGKGQRGLVLTPPRTGATSLLQSVAQSVTTNNPECHVMVVLVDARPEEVTDFQRAVKGEVVASTFDRQPADHTLVAELAIERAKRLVELGHDVVVLIDSLTRLGRAYNLAAPANGRVLGGLVDASAVHPVKEFFGAARKVEDGGSLTILATVAVGSGSATDEFFLEELAGTENLELVLSAEKAARGIVPAVDVAASGTRHEDRLLAPAEGAVVGDLRKQLAAAETPQAVAKVIGAR